MAIIGLSWQQARKMALTLALGFFGTLLLFFGLRAAMALLIKTGRRDTGLRVFNFRQLQENVIHRSSTMAVSSILILAALCCFGAGVAVANSYGKAEPHILDYTFEDYSCENAADGAAKIRDTLAAHGLDGKFAALFDMKIGSIRTTEDYDNAFKMASVMDALAALPQSAARDTLLNNLGIGGGSYPHIIALSSYNELLPNLTMYQGSWPKFISPEQSNPWSSQVVHQHGAIVSSIKLHIPALARQAMAEHIKSSLNFVAYSDNTDDPFWIVKRSSEKNDRGQGK